MEMMAGNDFAIWFPDNRDFFLAFDLNFVGLAER
jgi:hypothetical protein